MAKRYKDKRRACGLCKPWKRGWEDRRTRQEQVADEWLSMAGYEDLLEDYDIAEAEKANLDAFNSVEW